MKRTAIKSLIKHITKSDLSSANVGKKVLGSLLIIASLTMLSGIATTRAEVPVDSESTEVSDGFITEAERQAALATIAAEIRRLAQEKEDILWAARVIYSETKRYDEMPYIAWVLRNRVERGHRSFDYESGTNNYKGAALAKSQFSGMHPHLDRNAHRNLAMSYDTVGVPSWDHALAVAERVYYSDGSDRLLSSDTVYFYSPTVIAPPAFASPSYSREVLRFPTNRFAFYAPHSG
jgi:hypothetical protein